MLNFDVDLDLNRQGTRVTARQQVPVVQETVTITPVAVESSSVAWEEVRDYVMSRIEQAGPVPRNPRQENSIFMAFVSRWQALAMPIARHAFEDCAGMWMNAPVGVHRFHRSADAYFAQRIAKKVSA